MTPALAKAVWVIVVVLWYAIRYPFERRAKKTAVARTERDGTAAHPATPGCAAPPTEHRLDRHVA